MAVYSIAGIRVFMEPQHALTALRSKRYLTTGEKADLCVKGKGDANEEYATLARSFYEKLPCFDGFLLHASAVEYNGLAIAFSASSGTGKSTHASFWCDTLGASIINDDKPAVRLIEDTFCACGTPFSGKTDKSRNVCVPLKAIVFLERGDQTTLVQLNTAQALGAILNQTLRPNNADALGKLLDLLERLLQQVSVYKATVSFDPDSALQLKQQLFNKDEIV